MMRGRLRHPAIALSPHAAATGCCRWRPLLGSWHGGQAFVAILRFFQSLVELTDETNGHEEPPTPEENIEALIPPAPKKA